MAGQRGLDRNPRRLKITDFAYHDDVRVLTQDRAQCVGEVEADLGLHLDLVDSRQLVFDGIFHSEQFKFRAIEIFQRCLKCCGLTAAGRPGDQHDSVRKLHQAIQLFLGSGIETELGEIELDAGAVQNAHHDAFTENGRQR